MALSTTLPGTSGHHRLQIQLARQNNPRVFTVLPASFMFKDPVDLWFCYGIVTSNHLSQRELKSDAFLSGNLGKRVPSQMCLGIYAAPASGTTSSRISKSTPGMFSRPSLLAFLTLSLPGVQVSMLCFGVCELLRQPASCLLMPSSHSGFPFVSSLQKQDISVSTRYHLLGAGAP